MPYINVNFNRHRLCETGKLPSVYCTSLMANGVKHLGRQSANASSDANLVAIGHRMDAVIYSMIVAIFYAGIILIILLSNAHRFRTNKTRRKRPKRRPTRGLTPITREPTKTQITTTSPPTTTILTAGTTILTAAANSSLSAIAVNQKQLIVNTNKELTVCDSSDKYRETII